MAITHHIGAKNIGRIRLVRHPGWEDSAIMALGAIIFLSSLFFSVTDSMAVVVNTMLTGAVIVALGIMEVAILRRWEEALAFLAGLWTIASPYVIGYMDPLRTWHIALGVLVALIAALQLWQDRNRRLET
ncbi:SPW repeat domain-containing protein [Phyllobacterium leguminum]|uniref:SPW repeat-containing protein n=1 Tax=Phyllobacterium leguminum TaxID=314237 RepID=A0A318TL92_9HYPH|nr:SPW repeat protein [Phyllobacterium leguminum]PYE90187.1 SPW repeat-containing protein [Phyllobacterium leguminum]